MEEIRQNLDNYNLVLYIENIHILSIFLKSVKTEKESMVYLSNYN